MIERPVIIIGAPRSGTSILFDTLARHPSLWHLPSESHAIFEGPFHPSRRGYESNCVRRGEADARTMESLRRAFHARAIHLHFLNRWRAPVGSGRSIGSRAARKLLGLLARPLTFLAKPACIRLVEKTPKNTLRVPFLDELFPDAFFLFLTRDPWANIDSLVSAWAAVDRLGPLQRPRYGRSGYDVASGLGLRDYPRGCWKFALVPGWRSLRGGSLADAAALQYLRCNQIAFDDLSGIDARRVLRVRYEEFVADTVAVLKRILAWAGLPEDKGLLEFGRHLPPSEGGVAHEVRRALRNPDRVAQAIDGRPELGHLSRLLGYDLSSGHPHGPVPAREA